MVYSHCSVTGPGQVHALGPGSMDTNIFTDHVHSMKEGNVFTPVCQYVYKGSPFTMMHREGAGVSSFLLVGRITLSCMPKRSH